ncbi:MAG: Hsp20 family protein, partial [Pseudomonadota bacterium]
MTRLDGSLWISFGPAGKGAKPKLAESGYPPYNIEVLPAAADQPERMRITLAVAGFARDELDVSVTADALLIQGEKPDEDRKDYLHRGLASRRFRRTFALVDGVEVRKAELHNGLLAIELERPTKQAR